MNRNTRLHVESCHQYVNNKDTRMTPSDMQHIKLVFVFKFFNTYLHTMFEGCDLNEANLLIMLAS